MSEQLEKLNTDEAEAIAPILKKVRMLQALLNENLQSLQPVILLVAKQHKLANPEEWMLTEDGLALVKRESVPQVIIPEAPTQTPVSAKVKKSTA